MIISEKSYQERIRFEKSESSEDGTGWLSGRDREDGRLTGAT